MSYRLELKNDLTQGTILCVTLPIEEVDAIALKTTSNCPPPFLLSSQYRVLDDEIEVMYFIKSHLPLRYLKEAKDALSYIAFWNQILEPFVTCEDWFMNPVQFVLDIEYVYVDRNTGAVEYVYCPSKEPENTMIHLQLFLAQISKVITTTDVALENKVLKELQDFRLHDFTEMLKAHAASLGGGEKKKKFTLPPVSEQFKQELAPIRDRMEQPSFRSKNNPIAKAAASSLPPVPEPPSLPKQVMPVTPPMPSMPQKPSIPASIPDPFAQEDDIIFESPVSPVKSGGLFGKREKVPKPEKPKKEKKIKKANGVEMAEFFMDEAPPRRGSSGVVGGVADFGQEPVAAPPSFGGRSGLGLGSRNGLGKSAMAEVSMEEDGMTQLPQEELKSVGARLRNVGLPTNPPSIPLDLREGTPFVIGRFNVMAGVQQSDFEFGKDTQGVSRRHCAVEVYQGNYYIIDLGSKGGTTVNGQKVDMGQPMALKAGDRVSFGYNGIDYVFER